MSPSHICGNLGRIAGCMDTTIISPKIHGQMRRRYEVGAHNVLLISSSQSQNGKTLAWIIHVWQIPIGKIPHKEILNKVIIKERNTHGIKYQSINLDGWGRECLSLLWTDGTDLV